MLAANNGAVLTEGGNWTQFNRLGEVMARLAKLEAARGQSQTAGGRRTNSVQASIGLAEAATRECLERVEGV